VAGHLHLAPTLVELAVVTLGFALMVNKPF
jgi:hypothetical protein